LISNKSKENQDEKMYLTFMTHPDEHFDLTLRWLNDDVDPSDGRTITRIASAGSAIRKTCRLM
jgi:hypothetical protein